ncbi:MAG TPA: hypothetical protein PKM41_07425 [Deltaproteobacteria bacterium]|nr:hypothetical protein [Deltaproteobacteria bacterium]
MKTRTASKLLFMILICWGAPLNAELLTMEDSQMGDVTAQAGISISLDNATFYDEYGRIEIHGSDAGSLALEDVVVDNGNGWGYSFTTPTPLLIDLVDYNSGTLLFPERNVALNIYAASWTQNLQFTANHLVFCDQDLGKYQVGPINIPTFQFMLTTPDNDVLYSTKSGLYFRYLFQSNVNRLSLTYNSLDEALLFQGIRFARSFTGSAQTPSAWASQGSFLVGKNDTISGDESFASINVIKENNTLKLDMDIPMRGSVRIDNVQLGSRNCGPVAVDNIRVNNMSVQFIP